MKKFPQIMGILNITPDSFSDGGLFFDKNIAMAHAFKLIEDGADILDIGGESSRPGASPVESEHEMSRVVPMIIEIRSKNKDIKISIDTTKYEVAKAALDAGADIINDISGLEKEPRLAELAASANCPLIVMHKQGEPETMQQNPYYKNVVQEVFDSLKQKIEFARAKGVKTIIADPGIGFGKNYEHNMEILKHLDYLKKLDVPILLGISRKAFLGYITGIKIPSNRDVATTLMHSLLLEKEVDIIRVHNVKNIHLLKELWTAYNT